MLFKNNKLHIYFIVAVFFLFQSCKNKPNAVEANTTTYSAYESAEFQAFYQKFSTDSIYQLEHTVFPLEGMKSLQDSTEVFDPNFRWRLEDWVIHGPYDDMDGTYTREFVDFKDIVIEKISDASGQYTMERRFGKLSSGWHLIYYRELGRY